MVAAMQMPTRTFEDKEATREKVPLMVGVAGPSGGGKTFSALRIATGIQRVTGGDIFVIDTEARRALHYADLFKFRHVPFGAPFSPLDYLAAIEHCAKKGAGVVVIDSMSHEHEGPGGVLELHAEETARLAKLWGVKESKAQMSAWQAPKAMRRRMLNTILQLPISTVICFRAKEKLKIKPGEDPKPLGFMPIAGEEIVFEMTVCCLLLPRADGVPTWQSEEIGERMTMKLPRQFKHIFVPGAPLSEDIGEQLAQWAEGEMSAAARELLAFVAGADQAGLAAFPPRMEEAKKKRTITPGEYQTIRRAFGKRRDELAAAPAPTGEQLEQEEPGANG
jgi:hypothetical protein